MNEDHVRELVAVAGEAAHAAAEVARGWQRRSGALDVEEKAAADDLVSQADRDAETAARAVLHARRPADAILGEEHGSTRGTSGIRWAIDPIDGTTSYLYGQADWAVSVAAVRESDGCVLAGVVIEPVLDRVTQAGLGLGAWSGRQRWACRPTEDLRRALVEVNFGRPDQRGLAGSMVDGLMEQVRDVRRGGSAASSLAKVATGRAEAYWGPGLREWDAAAGMLIARESGAITGDLAGPGDGSWPASGDILAVAPGLWEGLVQILAPVYRDH